MIAAINAHLQQRGFDPLQDRATIVWDGEGENKDIEQNIALIDYLCDQSCLFPEYYPAAFDDPDLEDDDEKLGYYAFELGPFLTAQTYDILGSFVVVPPQILPNGEVLNDIKVHYFAQIVLNDEKQSNFLQTRGIVISVTEGQKSDFLGQELTDLLETHKQNGGDYCFDMRQELSTPDCPPS
jgi:hypothetical protein